MFYTRATYDPSIRPYGTFVFRPNSCDESIYRNVVVFNEYRIPQILAPEATIVDVGAHIGSFALACVQRGAGRICAFEAEFRNYQLACSHLREFKDKISIYHRAVWRSDGVSPMLNHSGYTVDNGDINTGGGNVIYCESQIALAASECSHQPTASPLNKVLPIALDEILRQSGTVQLLKLDCEGSEWPILLTSRELSRVEMICGEYHELNSNRSPNPIPPLASVSGFESYNESMLKTYLSNWFTNVITINYGSLPLGRFWAYR